MKTGDTLNPGKLVGNISLKIKINLELTTPFSPPYQGGDMRGGEFQYQSIKKSRTLI